MKITKCLFDAYYTLSGLNVAARRAANDKQNAFKKIWYKIAKIGQVKQLLSTLRRYITEALVEFWKLPFKTDNGNGLLQIYVE